MATEFPVDGVGARGPNDVSGVDVNSLKNDYLHLQQRLMQANMALQKMHSAPLSGPLVGGGQHPSGGEVYLALLNAALAVMTQRGGRVLGLPSPLGIWLRSSPIIAVADTILILSQLMIGIVRMRSLRFTINAVMSDRFEMTSSRKLDRFLLLRWLTVVIPAIAQIGGLVQAAGLPWSKTWFFCYLVSFMVLETCLLLWRYAAKASASASGTQTSSSPQNPGPRPDPMSFSRVRRVWAGLAILSQVILLVWAFGALWTRSRTEPSLPEIMLLGSVGWVSCTAVLACTLFGLQTWRPGWRSQLLLLDNTSDPGLQQVWQSVLGLTFTIEISCVAAAWYSTKY